MVNTRNVLIKDKVMVNIGQKMLQWEQQYEWSTSQDTDLGIRVL